MNLDCSLNCIKFTKLELNFSLISLTEEFVDFVSSADIVSCSNSKVAINSLKTSFDYYPLFPKTTKKEP